MINGELDEIDLNILRLLQDNARKSYKEIQNELGISIGTVHNRISKLKANNIIEGYTLKLNNSNLGYKLTFLLRIEIEGKHIVSFLQEISKMPEVCSVFHTTGEQSAESICRFKDLEDAYSFINDLHKNECVNSVNSTMVLKEYKNSTFVEIIGD